MAPYPDMFPVNEDGTVGETAQTLQVDLDVNFWDRSVSGTARWGQTIGTQAMRNCHGVFVVGNSGAWLCHNVIGDPVNVPPPFCDDDRHSIRLLGAAYTDKKGLFRGRQCYAFKLTAKDLIEVYVSESAYKEPPPAKPVPTRVVATEDADFAKLYPSLFKT